MRAGSPGSEGASRVSKRFRAAGVAVADLLLERRDTVDARALLTTLVLEPGFIDDDESRVIFKRLAAIGGAPDLQAWAHAGEPALRARRLMGVAEAFQTNIDARAANGFRLSSNGPDACLDVF